MLKNNAQVSRYLNNNLSKYTTPFKTPPILHTAFNKFTPYVSVQIKIHLNPAVFIIIYFSTLVYP